MRKYRKKIWGIIVAIICVVVLDTVQAFVFQNSPVIKIRENRDGGYSSDGVSLYCIDRGILVNAYQYSDGSMKVIFKWQEE